MKIPGAGANEDVEELDNGFGWSVLGGHQTPPEVVIVQSGSFWRD